MKDYKKYIFDIDYTILIPDWSKEDDYFKEHILENEQEEFFKNKQSILNKYEQEFPRYNTKTLSDYFKSYGFTVSEDTINGWMSYNGETIKDEVVDGVVDLFKYYPNKQNQNPWHVRAGRRFRDGLVCKLQNELCSLVPL